MADYPDFTGPKVGVYLQPQWAAFEGSDKDFYATVALPTWGTSVNASYVVPAGKTLYVTDFGCNLFIAQATYDDFWYVRLLATGGVGGASRLHTAGLGGCAISLSKPIVTPAGETFTVYATNLSDLTAANMSVTAHGYEV